MITEKDLRQTSTGEVFVYINNLYHALSVSKKGNPIIKQVSQIDVHAYKPKQLVTDIMRSYADQPFCFGEEIEVTDADPANWIQAKFVFYDKDSIYPYNVKCFNGIYQYKYARKIEKITIDGVEINKSEAEERYRILGEALGK